MELGAEVVIGLFYSLYYKVFSSRERAWLGYSLLSPCS